MNISIDKKVGRGVKRGRERRQLVVGCGKTDVRDDEGYSTYVRMTK